MSNNRTGAFRILRVVTNKWTDSVMRCLAPGDKRPTELMDQIKGVSQKMLTQTLRQMEDGGLVVRRVYAVVPPRVDYGLTALGVSLIAPLHALNQWAREHADEIAAVEAPHKPGRGSRRKRQPSKTAGTKAASKAE